ncbi:hypothetical protein E2C01_094169 [Portunus trituberculatus]|uniref:Uncharacterized protein n=1 Tax=Portunus trituberculatus TaxID=210409 RepID=A0A5B7K035_PORTR|nr:hypothetical protein [Portunus trituberculatus]
MHHFIQCIPKYANSLSHIATSSSPRNNQAHDTQKGTAVVQWKHARFGGRGISKRMGSNPGYGPSAGRASLLAVTVP